MVTLASLACMSLAPCSAQAKVYFSAFLPGGSGIARADFAGSGLETLQFQPSGFADGLALDVPDGKMYWTDTDASVIWSSELDGEGAQVVLDDFGAEPLGIALDLPAGKMYWTDSTGIKRANLDGSQSEVLLKGAARGFIALDPAARRMYWADWPTGTVKSAAMSLEPTVTTLASKQSCPFGVALDGAHGKLYWLELENTEQKKCERHDVIRRANLDGSNAETLVERPAAGFEGGLAVDSAGGKLYWTEAQARDISAAELDGSDVHTLFSTGEDVPEGLAVETADPHPANVAAPVIEGSAQVGAPVSCNPGAWTGTGPISLFYQWALASGVAIEGASAPTYVPPAEQEGAELVCAVTASDRIETSTATSAAVLIAPFPAALSTPVANARSRLVAGFALLSLNSRGSSARVSVFTSEPAEATLWALPRVARRAHRHRASSRRWQRRTRRAVASRSRARRTGPRARRPRGPRERSHRFTTRMLRVSTSLAPGRDTLTLHGLTPGVSYRLLLTITAADGEAVSERAILRVHVR